MRKQIVSMILAILMIFTQVNFSEIIVYAETSVQEVTLTRSQKYVFPSQTVTVSVDDSILEDANAIDWKILYYDENENLITLENTDTETYYEISEDEKAVELQGAVFEKLGVNAGNNILVNVSISKDALQVGYGSTYIEMKYPIYQYSERSTSELIMDSGQTLGSNLSCYVVNEEYPNGTYLFTYLVGLEAQDNEQDVVILGEEDGSFTISAASVGTTTIIALYESLDGSEEPVQIPFTVTVTDTYYKWNITTDKQYSEDCYNDNNPTFRALPGDTVTYTVKLYRKKWNYDLQQYENIELNEDLDITLEKDLSEYISSVTSDSIELSDDKTEATKKFYLTVKEGVEKKVVTFEFLAYVNGELVEDGDSLISIINEYISLEFSEEDIEKLEDFQPYTSITVHPIVMKNTVTEDGISSTEMSDITFEAEVGGEESDKIEVEIDNDNDTMTMTRMSKGEFYVRLKVLNEEGTRIIGRLFEYEYYNYDFGRLIPVSINMIEGEDLTISFDPAKLEKVDNWSPSWDVGDYDTNDLFSKGKDYTMSEDETSIVLHGSTIAKNYGLGLNDDIDVELTIIVDDREIYHEHALVTISEPCAHTYVEDTKRTIPATCKTEGSKILVCSKCNAETTETIPADGISHVYDTVFTVDVEPTETTVGSKSLHCTESGCDGRTSITVIPMTGDVYAEADNILEKEELNEEDVTMLNSVVESLFATGQENNAELIIENGMTIEEIEKLEELYISYNENVGETSIICDGNLDGATVGGAALAVAEYIYNQTGEYSARLSINQMTAVSDNTDIQTLIDDDNALVLDINLALIDVNGNLVEGAEDIQPAAPMRISIPISEEWKDNSFKLYHYNDSGEKEEIEYAITDNTLVFVVTALSYYTLEATEPHIWSEWKVTSPTCQEEGYTFRTCSHCSGIKKKDITAKVEHDQNVILSAVAATETATGLTEGKKCSMCGKTMVEQIIIPKLPVKQEEDSTAEQETVIPHTHSYTYVSNNDATIFADGTKTGTCSCGITKVVVDEGTRLEAVLKVPSTSFTMKVKQTYKGFKVTMSDGDYITSVTSSNKRYVKVSGLKSKKGTFTIKAQKKTGKSTITITLASGKTQDIKVKVQKKAVTTKKIIGLKGTVTVKKGRKVTIKPVIKPITSTQKVKFKSLNKKIATVTSKGVVYGKKKGTAKIRVTSGKVKKTIKIKVK